MKLKPNSWKEVDIKAYAIILVFCAILFTYLFTRTPQYYVMRPGKASELGKVTTLEGQKLQASEGGLYMVSVDTRDAVRLDHFIAPFVEKHFKGWELRSYKEDVERYIPGEHAFVSRNTIEDSILWSKQIAFLMLGHEIAASGEGAQITKISKDSFANDVLQEGDIIKEIDGKQINTIEGMSKIVFAKKPGDSVSLVAKRSEDEEIHCTLTLIEHPHFPSIAAVGVTIKTYRWQPIFPKEIELNINKVQGPSGEMIFALNFLDVLSEDVDMAKGYKIAGTGTMLDMSRVGSIEGIVQKLYAVEKAKADYFIVPRANYKEIEQIETSVKVVPVETIEEALQFINALPYRSSE